jgi:hypothetical protein
LLSDVCPSLGTFDQFLDKKAWLPNLLHEVLRFSKMAETAKVRKRSIGRFAGWKKVLNKNTISHELLIV